MCVCVCVFSRSFICGSLSTNLKVQQEDMFDKWKHEMFAQHNVSYPALVNNLSSVTCTKNLIFDVLVILMIISRKVLKLISIPKLHATSFLLIRLCLTMKINAIILRCGLLVFVNYFYTCWLTF